MGAAASGAVRAARGYHRRMAIYLDHAATTPLHPEVLEAMLPYLTEHHGNPSSIHASGRRARQGLDEAREEIAALIGAKPREIVFTGSAGRRPTTWRSRAWPGPRARAAGTSSSASPSTRPCSIPRPSSSGRDSPSPRSAWTDTVGSTPTPWPTPSLSGTVLVSVQAANNEVGTIQPVAEIGAVCRERRVPFHVDAVQSAAFAPPAARRVAGDADQPVGAQAARSEGIRRAVGAAGYRDAAAAQRRRPGAAATGGDRERGRRRGLRARHAPRLRGRPSRSSRRAIG